MLFFVSCIHDSDFFYASNNILIRVYIKILLSLGRDCTWTPTNKRPEKLRDNIKELEVTINIVYTYIY